MDLTTQIQELRRTFPGRLTDRGPHFCLPPGLIEELGIYAGLARQDVRFELALTCVCTNANCIGIADARPIRYDALMPRVDPETKLHEHLLKAFDRALSYAGQLICKPEFNAEWEEVVTKHSGFIELHGYPMPHLNTYPETTYPQEDGGRDFWADYFQFGTRWGVRRMVAPHLPLLPLPSFTGNYDHNNEPFGFTMFVPYWWWFDSTFDIRDLTTPMLTAVRNQYRNECQNDWPFKGPWAVEDVSTPGLTRGAFLCSYGMHVIKSRHPGLLAYGHKTGTKGRFLSWLGVEHRQFSKYEALLGKGRASPQ